MKIFLEMFAALESQGLKFFVTSPILTIVYFAREHKQALIGKKSVYKSVFEPFSTAEAPRLVP